MYLTVAIALHVKPAFKNIHKQVLAISSFLSRLLLPDPDIWIWIILPLEIQLPLFALTPLSLQAVLSSTPTVRVFECCTFSSSVSV